MKHDNIRNILVIKLRNIGDVLLSTPVFSNLKFSFPDSRLCALVNSGTEEMLLNNPDINNIYIFDRKIKNKPLLKKVWSQLQLLSKIRNEHFDLVINLTEGDRGAIVAAVSGARIRIGLDSLGKGMAGKNHIFNNLISRPDQKLHTVEQNLTFLNPLSIPVVSKRTSFFIDDNSLQYSCSLLSESGLYNGRFIHAHLTSRWMFKTMPPERAAFLVDEMANSAALPVVFTSSQEKKEISYLNEVLNFTKSRYHDFSGELTLKQLGALSSQASFFIGVDSAPMHIAAALNVPVFGVFGPSSAVQWGPWDNELSDNPYIEKRGIQQTENHFVLQSEGDCVPCHRDGCNGSKVSACLDFADDVLKKAVSDFITKLRSKGVIGSTFGASSA